ncbi:MAG: putative ORFan [Harvfovirus sp.]|uniref:Putative ORFan n=1 Tax=Harvfovirus sp. TaxID=2487768 RepID=A0A3G5A3U4_9VIRU|nr:MAG: putative ORFan [Harvfovirus sp.]
MAESKGLATEIKNKLRRQIDKLTYTSILDAIDATDDKKTIMEKIEIAKHFLIQYGCFDFHHDGIYFNSCLIQDFRNNKNEGIYCAKVTFNESTKVRVNSFKGNYSRYTLSNLGDYRGKSVINSRIYAADLYDDFMPRHFAGSVETRGGFVGWNWFKIHSKKKALGST